MSSSLTRALYPHGRCCRYNMSDMAGSYPPYELELKDTRDRKYQMILSDPRSSSIFKEQGFNMRGDRLVSGETSVFKYYIRISQEIHLEDDPKFSCTEYRQDVLS